MLKSFDLVIASVHSRFRMSKAEQTERIVKAVANPHTTILGHVTGRLLLKRPDRRAQSMESRSRSIPTRGDWILTGGGARVL